VITFTTAVGPYDMDKKVFPLQDLAADGAITFQDAQAADYRLHLSNGADFKMLKVEDEATARKIEKVRTMFKNSLRISLFLQGADPTLEPGDLIAQVLQVDLVDGSGKLLASSARP
jgi:hypothetical protein